MYSITNYLIGLITWFWAVIIIIIIVVINVKQSRYTPWRCLGGEEV
jgi:hypothetical protein